MAAMPRSETTAGRRTAYRQGLALPPASPGTAPGFPVTDADHWDRARRAVGRVQDPARRAALGKLLRKTAPRFGRTEALKQSWAAPKGSSHANPGSGIYLAERAMLDNGQMLTCPECSYTGPANRFGASGASLDRQPAILRTPARANPAARAGFAPGSSGIQPKAGSAAHALANSGAAVELATGTLTARRHPVSGPLDVIVARGPDGKAMLRHRNGGAEIAALRKNDDGTWTATVNGQDLAPRQHQRTALMEAVGTWNKAIASAVRPQEAPLQPAPRQTPLMAEYGIPAIRALATPMTSSASGPRMTAAGGPVGDADGLSPRGRSIYKRLCDRGVSQKAAMAMARRAQAKTARAA